MWRVFYPYLAARVAVAPYEGSVPEREVTFRQELRPV